LAYRARKPRQRTFLYQGQLTKQGLTNGAIVMVDEHAGGIYLLGGDIRPGRVLASRTVMAALPGTLPRGGLVPDRHGRTPSSGLPTRRSSSVTRSAVPSGRPKPSASLEMNFSSQSSNNNPELGQRSSTGHTDTRLSFRPAGVRTLGHAHSSARETKPRGRAVTLHRRGATDERWNIGRQSRSAYSRKRRSALPCAIRSLSTVHTGN
jgi:hypothetical protein